jgi:hypothetical protein
MRFRIAGLAAIALILSVAADYPQEAHQAKNEPVADVLRELVNRSALAEPGGVPFYLKAKVQDAKNPDWEYNAEVEEYWVSPSQWRRTIRSKSFSQVRVVNGERQYQQDIGNFFPPDVEMQIDSLVDPIPARYLQKIASLGLVIQQLDGHPG